MGMYIFLSTFKQMRDVYTSPFFITITVKTVDAKGFKTTSEYNSRGFLTSQKQYSTAAEEIETTYEYDGEGRLTQFAYGAIGKENERHIYKNILDRFGRITQSIDNMGNIGYTEYDANLNVIRTTDRNGISTEFRYDGLNNVIAQTNSKSGQRNTNTTISEKFCR